MKSCAAVVVLVALFSCAALGQNAAPAPARVPAFSGSASFGPPPPFGMRPITGAPYSGEQVSESLQVLADGTRISRTGPTMRFYRDSSGRTRTERPVSFGLRAPESPLIVEITDPEGQVKYTLDTVKKVAHRQELPPPPGPVPARPAGVQDRRVAGVASAGAARAGSISVTAVAPSTGEAIRIETTSEDLGTQTIDGLLVEGRRTTSTWPAGYEGNDRPIVVTTESWVSRELMTTVLSKRYDPRTGEHTQKLINVSRNEPDPTLFQLPPDYTVVDEKGEFTIKWTSGPR